MSKIVTFGEILMRLTPPGYLKLSQANSLCATFGGSETNVAVSLAHFGMDSEFVTRLPQNDIAQACVMDLRSHGVGTSNIVYGGDRLGLYYFENTSSDRVAKVVYDRANSSFCTLKPGMIDWDKAFEGADWFHWSGIGPSLSEDAAAVVMEGIMAAEKRGITISSDLNFRKNLWKYGKKAEEVMPAFVKHCDVMFGTEGEYQKAFGVTPIGYDVKSATESFDLKAHEEFCKAVMAQAPKCKKMFVALRNVLNANTHILTQLLYTKEGQFYAGRTYEISHVVDCVGCGDAMCAGLIYGLKNFDNDEDALNFSVAAGTLKNTIVGDYNLVTADEVMALMKGNASGRISR
ncbi:MAG: sugar kinase [Bacteroidales bacterium]|nr:sugar kinase [Bacteroidales bacterium]